MLIVRHRTGPLAGKEQSVEGASERILIGRDAEACEIVFPADETLVSRRHFALVRKPSGDWTFDLFGDPYVAVNGHPAETGRGVRTGDIIELGKPGGPSFELALGDKGFGQTLPPTQVQARFKGSWEMARGARRTAVAGVALAAIATIAAAGFWYLATSDAARLGQAMASLTEAQAEAASESIGPAVRDRVMQASYVVVGRRADGRESAFGTASPIGPNLLATNAHIVEAAHELGPEARIFVRSPGPSGKSYEVIERRAHPGYTAFSKFLQADPFYVKSAEQWLRARGSYDVGVLRVAQGSDLGPVLEIASVAELEALKPGTPLVMAGYPLERISGGEVQAIGATPTLSIGMVTALTDMFSLPADPSQRRLVQHNLPGTGGNSGSPMLTPNGKLVALHNAGSYIHVPSVGRVPNAALVRFAQRADFLRELVDGTADAKLAAERAYWEKQTAAFKRGIDVLVPDAVEKERPQPGAKPVLVSSSKHMLLEADRFRDKDRTGNITQRRQKTHSVKLKKGQTVTFVAYAQDLAEIEIYLVLGQKIVALKNNGRWYQAISHAPSENADATVYVVDPKDKDVSYTLFEYAWEPPRS